MLDIMPAVERMAGGARRTHLNVSVSLDGLEERHNAARKIPGGFARAVANMRRMAALQQTNPRFSVSASISLARDVVLHEAGGTSEAVRLVEFLRDDVGVDTIGYDHIRSAATDAYHLPAALNSGFGPPPTTAEDPRHRHQRTADLDLAVDEMESANAELRPFEQSDATRLTMRRLQIQADIKRSRSRVVDCLAGFVDCVVYPSGDVAVCEFTKPFANLRSADFDLEAVMHGPAAERARALTRRCACTHPCHLSDSLAYDADFLKFYLSDRPSWNAPRPR
jgi:hypothetical protein